MLREKLLALLNCSQSLARNSRSLTAVLAEMIRQLEIVLPEACGYLVLFLAKDIQPRIMAFGGARSPRNRPLQELLREAASAKGEEVKIIRVDSTLNGPSMKGNRFSAVAPIKSGRVYIGHIVSGFRTAKDAERATELLKAMSELAGIHTVNARERESATARSRYLWEHDAVVTNLPNRRLFRKRARKAFASGLATVVFLDLDGFKTVNRDFGYARGDDVLKAVARRLKEIVHKTCRGATLARAGGDEFVVLLPNQGINEAKALAKRLIGGLREPLHTNEAPLPRASAGISRFPDDGAHVDEVLRSAEAAMFLAKALGGDRSVVATQRTVRRKEGNKNA
jgi:diguanylate cyclase (GGDEF)-like protein